MFLAYAYLMHASGEVTAGIVKQETLYAKGATYDQCCLYSERDSVAHVLVFI